MPLLPVPVAALSRCPGLPLNTGLVRLYPAVVFPPSLEGSAMYCCRALASRPGVVRKNSILTTLDDVLPT